MQRKAKQKIGFNDAKAREIKWQKQYPREIIVNNLFPPRIAYDMLHFSYYDDAAPTINKNGFYITGPVGSGKTTLACKIMLNHIKEQYINKGPVTDVGRFWSIPELLQEIRMCYGSENNNKEKELIDALINTPWIILDDFGMEKTTEWVLQTLYVVINARYNQGNKRVTIVTSNLSPNKLANKLDDRITSRIMGMLEIISMENEDFRITENRKNA